MIFRAEKLLFKLVLIAVFAGVVGSFAPSALAQKKKPAPVKSKKPTKAELARQAEIARQQQAEREAAEARRQAALEAQRRREQAAREARQRQLNFERGMKEETLANIASDNAQGEDPEVRRAAINALAGHAGTVVVMEPQTGKVLAIVNQDWGIRKGFRPCSTIKLVTATAGINEGVIDTAGNIQTRRFPMELNDALAFSNNSYFQAVGTSGLGNAKMISYARSLGLGEPTGINAPNEIAGKLPYGNNNAKIYSHGDDFEVTPLQLAVVVSAISNGGKLVVPQIPRPGFEKASFSGQMKRQVNVMQSTLQEILPGMVGAVNYGTARKSGSSAFAAAGKTGSCIGQGSWLGLFASVAPVVNPQLAVVVVTRGSGERGKYAAAVAGKVYEALSYRIKGTGSSNQPLLAKLPETLKPRPQVDAKKSASVDTDEGEDSDEGDVNEASSTKHPNPKKGGDDVVENAAHPTHPLNINNPVPRKEQKTTSPYQTTIIQVGRGEISRPRIVRTDNQ